MPGSPDADGAYFQRNLSSLRRLAFRVSISRWLLLLVGASLTGYAVFGIEYLLSERAHSDLLRKNSVYIEFENYVRIASANHQIAMFAVANAAAMPNSAVRSSAAGFAETARAAAAENKVEALREYFKPILDGVEDVEKSLSPTSVDLGRLERGLKTAEQNIDLLALIAGEGRKAEWANLLAGNQSSFVILMALICTGSVVVGAMGYFISTYVRRTFSDVLRINREIAEAKSNIEIAEIEGNTEAAQLYAALQLFHRNTREKTQGHLEK